MGTALREIAWTDTYEDVEKLIYDTVHQFNRRYGVDVEESIGVGKEIFMKVLTSPIGRGGYDRSRGSFTNWLRFKIWHELLERKEKEARNYSRLKRVDVEDWSRFTVAAPPPGRWAEIREELSTDAKMIVHVMLDPPLDVTATLKALGTPTPHRMRRAVMEFFCDLGWSKERVADSFNEIRRVICGEPVPVTAAEVLRGLAED